MPFIDGWKCFETAVSYISHISFEKEKYVSEIYEHVISVKHGLEKTKNIWKVIEGDSDAAVGEVNLRIEDWGIYLFYFYCSS